VSPANTLPSLTKQNGGKVCLVNLQNTIYDEKVDLRIFSKTDLVFKLLMNELGINIPEFDISTFFME